MARFDGRVAVVSGAARGQGRAHAVALAREGAEVAVFDICRALEFPMTPGATADDLQTTRALVEAEGRTCLAASIDARDLAGLSAFAARVRTELGGVDLLCINHGIWAIAPNSWELSQEAWQETIDVNLTGAWKVAKAFVPLILEGGRGGAIVFTGSINAVQPHPAAVAYTAAKHGLVGLMKTLAAELGPFKVRVNLVNPGCIDTAMFREGGTVERALEFTDHLRTSRAMLPDSLQPPESISDAVVWLCSDEARYVTGATVPVDSGWTAR